MLKYKIYFLLLLISISCRKDINDDIIKVDIVPGPVVLVESTIYGRVIDYSDNPISNAKVFVGNQSIFTDENGVFVLPEMISRESLGILDAYHTDYLPTHSLINSFVGDTISCNIKMKLSNDLVEFDALNPMNEVQLGSLRITTKNASFESSQGIKYDKAVHLRGDDSDDKEQAIYNNHMIGLHEMEDVILDPVGEFEIYWMDEIKYNEIVAVDLIPAQWAIQKALLNRAPNEILVWHYNRESKRWQSTGKAYKKGSYYEFELKQNGKYCLANFNKIKFLEGKLKNYDGLKLPNLDLHFKYGQLGNYHQIKTSTKGEFRVYLPVKEGISMEVKSQCNEVIQSIDLGEVNENIVWNDAFKLSDEQTAFAFGGVLLDCDNNASKEGYITIRSNNWMTQILLPNERGVYQNIYETCGNDKIEIQGFDKKNGTSGIPMSYRLNSDISESIVKSCKPIWESKFVIFDGTNHYNYDNCQLNTKDSGNQIVSSFHFQSDDSNLGSIDHVVRQQNNATLGDFWTIKSTSNSSSKFQILKILSDPFIRQMQDSNQDWWIEMEVNNVVLYNTQTKVSLENSRLYYFAKRDY